MLEIFLYHFYEKYEKLLIKLIILLFFLKIFLKIVQYPKVLHLLTFS